MLEKCVDSVLKHKAQIVWFSWKTFYDGIANVNGGGESTQKNLPPFVKPLEKYFSDSNEAWAYFSAFSWCAIASEFVKFCDNYGNKAICEKLKECFLGHLLSESCAIMNFKADPYNVRDYF